MTVQLDRGILVAFEGIDGAGKTTQAARLASLLRLKGFEVVTTKEPTNGRYGQVIRQSARAGRLPAEEELALFLEDRREHLEQLVRPALERGAVVIVDRYYFSTVAYQGARGMQPSMLLALNEDFAEQPDLLVILDIDPAVGLQRVHGRGDVADLFENVHDLTRARAIFQALDKPFALHLDATLPVDELGWQVSEALYHGPLLRRMCTTARDEGADYCGHQHGGDCPWVQIGEGLERPATADQVRQLEAIMNDVEVDAMERVERVRALFAQG